ncbi:MAG: hypothetical protein LUH23_04805 [Oscillospiraceae bacterium]|nr:hypothetical protein [Oscillospiraceae bacterium]
MVVVKKKAKNGDRGVAVGANLGLIATVIMAVRGWFEDKKHQRELARRKRLRKIRMTRLAVKTIRTLAYFIPMVIALAKAAGFIAEKRAEKNEENEPEDIDIEIIQAEPVSSEAEVYEKVNSESPEKD